VYRFLATPRWLGLAALTIAAIVIMILLGQWQLDRYRERSAINARVEAAATATPVPVGSVLAPPEVGGGPPPPEDRAWTRVTVTGVYDPTGEILVRGRTVAGRVGFEVITPLRVADGSAVLVDRGWVPAAPEGPTARPSVPPAVPGVRRRRAATELGRSQHRPDGHRGGGGRGRDAGVDRGSLPVSVQLPLAEQDHDHDCGDREGGQAQPARRGEEAVHPTEVTRAGGGADQLVEPTPSGTDPGIVPNGSIRRRYRS